MEKALKKHIKFKVNKVSNDTDLPQYSVSYMSKSTKTDNRKTSFELISALKGDSDVVLEVNTSLFNVPQLPEDKFVAGFLEDIRRIGFDYLYRKVPASSKSFFSQLLGLGKKNAQAHEILVYIPDESWKKGELYNIIPAYGVKYYITKDNSQGRQAMDDIYLLTDDERLDTFKLIIFDISYFAQMGITSRSLTADDIKRLIGI
ncbi:MAG TPA: hypothetical protein GXX14_05420 [Clostridiaceae bacterium]|nr:hypothetical protein [Clostridiaceae bacterium]